jgi:hypothetical protein
MGKIVLSRNKGREIFDYNYINLFDGLAWKIVSFGVKTLAE